MNRCLGRCIGASALSFGAGVLLSMVLPTGALVFIEAVLICGAGVALFIK